MKINQVEELVGITKKNIRFYEEQGLISPGRDRENGYREYTLADAALLSKIKLLRRLDVPLAEIKRMEDGEISVSECLERHITGFTRRQQELGIMKEMCRKIIDSGERFDSLDAASFLEDMKDLEKGGVRFTDVKRTDIKKSKRAPIIIACLCVVFFLTMVGVMIFEKQRDPSTPIAVVLVFAIVFGSMAAGTLIALRQRLKEIEGGEMDEAGKY